MDQPTATIAAAIIAATGVTGAAIINKVNWTPAIKPKENGNFAGNSILVIKTVVFLMAVGFMMVFSIVRLIPFYNSQKLVTAGEVIEIGVPLMGMVIFAFIFFGFIGVLIGHFRKK